MELYAVNSLKESLFQYKVKNLGENPYAILMNQAFLRQLKYETYSDPTLSLQLYEKEETLYYGNIPILLHRPYVSLSQSIPEFWIISNKGSLQIQNV